MYYPCSENKGADQLRGYREADLCLCFRICEKPVFSRRGSFCMFQVITPFRNLVLCAESRKDMEEWITALKTSSKKEYFEVW